MKINWGTGILIFIILFLIAIISFVIFASTHKVNLVEKDYYPKELNFDSQIEKNANAEALYEKISISKTDSLIIIDFPGFFRGKTVEGSILLYRPSDFEKDKLFSIQLDTSLRQVIPATDLLPGKYYVKIDWSCDGIPYFQEKVIIN